ncbi:MAG: hypothetical protein ACKUBY_01475 [Candidatus Moraniibacteriota bacterium]
MEKHFKKSIEEKQVSQEFSQKRNMTRRSFIKSAVGAALVVASEPVVGMAEALANNNEQLSDKEKIDQFVVKLVGSTKDQIPQMTDGDNKMQSFSNNFRYILDLLIENKNLVDETTYAGFANLQQAINRKNFSRIEVDQAMSELLVHFANNGYFFNIYNQVNDEDLFIKGSNQEILLEQYEGITKVFPQVSGKKTNLFYVDYDRRDKENIIFGVTTHGQIMINMNEHDRYFESEASIAKEKYPFLEELSKENFIKHTESNELAHKVLNFVYHFSPLIKHDWQAVDSGTSDYQIKNSEDVYEFLSDAVSMNTEPEVCVLMILSANGFKESYGYSIDFLKSVLNKKMKISGVYEKREIFNEEQRMSDFLKGLSSEDFVDIQNAFLEQSRVLIDEIEKINISSS